MFSSSLSSENHLSPATFNGLINCFCSVLVVEISTFENQEKSFKALSQHFFAIFKRRYRENRKSKHSIPYNFLK